MLQAESKRINTLVLSPSKALSTSDQLLGNNDYTSRTSGGAIPMFKSFVMARDSR